MSNYSELCVADAALLGTGVGVCAKSLGADVKFFLAESTFTGTAAQLKTKAYWDAAIIAKTVIPFPAVQEIEPQDIEASYFESAAGSTFLVKAEKRKTMFQFIENIVVHSGMKSHANRSWNIWYYTEKGYLRCHTKGVDSYEGLKASRFYVNAQTTQNFSDPSHTPVIIEQNEVEDWDMEYAVLQPDFDMKDLEGVYQADVVVNSAATATGDITLSVTATVKGTNAILTGLVLADMELKDESGVIVNLTSVTETASTGVYTIVATDDATIGTIGLKGVITIGSDNYQSLPIAFATA